MDGDNTNNAENTPEANVAPAANPAAEAGKAAANEAKAEMERTYAQIKGAGLRGIFGFDALYYPIIARILWIVAFILLVLLCGGFIIAGFSKGIGAGIAGLIIIPIFGLFYAVMIRVWFEFMIVLFRINDGIQELVRKMK